MKRVHVLMVWLSAIVAPSVAAQDAATEVQEGDVKHWIEYYKRERGLGNETVTQEEGAQNPTPQKASKNEGGSASTRPVAADADADN